MPSIHQPTTRDTGASRRGDLVREYEDDLKEFATAFARRDFRKNGQYRQRDCYHVSALYGR